MSSRFVFCVAATLLVPSAKRAWAVPTVESSASNAGPVERLVSEALDSNPDYARAKAAAEADRERVPQVGALPDPILSLGIQNDSFTAIKIGEAETSWYWIVASQAFPWFGKQGLRRDVATLPAASLAAMRA